MWVSVFCTRKCDETFTFLPSFLLSSVEVALTSTVAPREAEINQMNDLDMHFGFTFFLLAPLVAHCQLCYPERERESISKHSTWIIQADELLRVMPRSCVVAHLREHGWGKSEMTFSPIRLSLLSLSRRPSGRAVCYSCVSLSTAIWGANSFPSSRQPSVRVRQTAWSKADPVVTPLTLDARTQSNQNRTCTGTLTPVQLKMIFI